MGALKTAVSERGEGAVLLSEDSAQLKVCVCVCVCACVHVCVCVNVRGRPYHYIISPGVIDRC